MSTLTYGADILMRQKICPLKSYCMPMLMYGSKTQTWTMLDNGSRCKYRRKTKGKQKKDGEFKAKYFGW